MRHRIHAAIGVIALGFTAGCLTLPPPTPISGPRESVHSLVGEWSGYYVGKESQRSGSIEFVLLDGDSVAYGNVVMVPREYAMQDINRREEHHIVPPPRLLQITFVHVTDSELRGVLEPYMDPDCDCPVVTTFTGRTASKDKFFGTFVTRQVETAHEHTGRWEVQRRKEH